MSDKTRTKAGGLGDFSAKTLSASLLEAGIELQRLKTGTPPRILGPQHQFSGACRNKRATPAPTLFAFHDTRDPEDLFHVEQTGETPHRLETRQLSRCLVG